MDFNNCRGLFSLKDLVHAEDQERNQKHQYCTTRGYELYYNIQINIELFVDRHDMFSTSCPVGGAQDPQMDFFSVTAPHMNILLLQLLFKLDLNNIMIVSWHS